MHESKNFKGCVEILNFTSNDEAAETLVRFQWSGADELLTKVILPTVISVGVLGNLAFLFTVARISRMRTVTNFYLVNLAVADILFLLITMSAQIHKYRQAEFRGSVPYTSQWGCWASVFPIFLSYFASLELVTLVSLERYYSICKPVQHRLIHGKKHTINMIIGAWVVATFLAILSTPRFGTLQQQCIIWPDEQEYKGLPNRYHQCLMVNIGLGLLAEIIQLVLFSIALVISCVTYFQLIKTLSSTKLVASAHQAKRNQQVRNQVARILIIIGVIFFLCQLPNRVINVDKFVRIATGTIQPSYGTIFEISFGLLLLNSAVNPFIYGFGSRLYRTAFCEAFGLSSCVKKDGSSLSPDNSQRISKNQGSTVSRSTTV